MTNASFKRRDGFQGQKLISLPQQLWKSASRLHPEIFQLYITHIGYFPKAEGHFRERKKGCEDNILIYCLHGKGYFTIGKEKHELLPNQFIHIPATAEYQRYGADPQDPWSIYWVHYRGDKIEGFNNSLNITLSNGVQQIPFNEKGIAIWENIYHSLEMGYSMDNLCNASLCLYHFIATFAFPDKHILTEKKESDDMVNQTILNMKANLGGKLTVKEMSEHVKLSSSHFSNLFRKSTGISPIDYFIHLKMQRACQLLYSKDVKIKRIADELGYEDPFYFSRIFKKNMGMSPEQYRLVSSKGD
ncbi:MAG: AraC family transcriptional regulator [Bacteroidota bacterium]